MKLFSCQLECLILTISIEYQLVLFVAFYVLFILYIVYWSSKPDKELAYGKYRHG